MKQKRTIVARAAMAVASVALLSASGTAFAAASMLSDFALGWKDEIKVILPALLLGFAAAGIFMAAWGVISSITTKKQQQPLTWQLFAICGGAAAVVIPVIIMAVSGSLTSGQGDASGQFDELGVKY
jgi:MFS family permease